MSKAWNRSILAAVLGVGVLLSQGCCGNENRTKRKEIAPKTVAEAKSDFSLTSKDFSEEYEKDREKFQGKYDGKIVELTGIVTDIGGDLHDSWLDLEGASGDKSGVSCTTADSQPWLKVLPGQMVKLKGKIPERPTGTKLLACVILNSSGPLPPTLTAEEIRKEYAKDRKAYREKYYRQFLFLSGEVVSVRFNKVGEAWVLLKTSASPPVYCHFGATMHFQSEGLKPGDKIKVLGRYDDESVKEVSFDSCIRFEQGR